MGDPVRDGTFAAVAADIRKSTKSMQTLRSRQMTIVADDGHSTITEVVKLPVHPENLQRMMDYVQEWHETIIPALPGFQGAALLSSPVGAVFVYANWSSKEAVEAAN